MLQTVGVQLTTAPSIAEAASAPRPPPPRPDEPPLFTRAHSSGHSNAELELTPFGALSPAELLLLVEAEEEWARVCQTDFRRIYPSPYASSQARLLRLFEHVRLPDALLSAYSRRAGRAQELQEALDACPEALGPSVAAQYGADAGAVAASSSKSSHPRAAPASASATAAPRRRMPTSAPVRRAPPTASSRSASATKQRASSARAVTSVTSPGGGGAACRATVGGGSPSAQYDAKHNGRRSPSPADSSSHAPARAATAQYDAKHNGRRSPCRAPPALPQAPVLPQSASRKRRPSSSDGHSF